MKNSKFLLNLQLSLSPIQIENDQSKNVRRMEDYFVGKQDFFEKITEICALFKFLEHSWELLLICTLIEKCLFIKGVSCSLLSFKNYHYSVGIWSEVSNDTLFMKTDDKLKIKKITTFLMNIRMNQSIRSHSFRNFSNRLFTYVFTHSFISQ